MKQRKVTAGNCADCHLGWQKNDLTEVKKLLSGRNRKHRRKGYSIGI